MWMSWPRIDLSAASVWASMTLSRTILRKNIRMPFTKFGEHADNVPGNMWILQLFVSRRSNLMQAHIECTLAVTGISYSHSHGSWILQRITSFTKTFRCNLQIGNATNYLNYQVPLSELSCLLSTDSQLYSKAMSVFLHPTPITRLSSMLLPFVALVCWTGRLFTKQRILSLDVPAQGVKCGPS